MSEGKLAASIVRRLEATYGKRATWLITGWMAILFGVAFVGLLALTSHPPSDRNDRLGIGLGVAFVVIGVGYAVAAAFFMKPDGSWRRRRRQAAKLPPGRKAKRRKARKARRRGRAA